MFFFGTEARKLIRGVVADYCPYCCDVRAFELRDHYRHRHLFGLPLWGGKFIARTRGCRGCGRDLSFDSRKYVGVVPMTEEWSVSVPALLARTNPRVAQRLAELDRLEVMAATAKAMSYRGQGADERLVECVHLLRWLTSADVDEGTVQRVASWPGLDDDGRDTLLAELRAAADRLRSALAGSGA